MNIFRQKLTNLFSRILFGRSYQSSYRRFRFILFVGMVAISLIPVYVTTALHYFEYRDLLRQEEWDRLRLDSLGGKRKIEAYVDKSMSVVRFISMHHAYTELLDQNVASDMLELLRDEYSGVVDLGIVNPDGKLQTYAGPYRLQGVNYSGQQWYNQVLARKVYVSNVFMGFRDVPHFVIAVSNKLPGKQEYWVLRVTIDIKSLEQVISQIVAKEARDIFLVDAAGLFQTPSRNFGGVLNSYDHFFQPLKNVIELRKKEIGGQEIIQAVAAIENSPWFLVLTKVSYTQSELWKTFSSRIRMIIIGSSVLVLVVIFQVVDSLTNRLKNEEMKKRALLSEAEQTSKLVSIGRLAAGVAHEVNNPLAVISQNAGLMADLIELYGEEFEHREKFTTSVSAIQNAVERCKRITHRLLGFARRMDTTLEKIDINDLLREVLGFLEKEALYSHIQIDLKLKDDLPLIVSDRGQLQQIFLNILNNGIDAIGKDGKIEIRTRVILNGMVQVAIEDTGPGMAPDVMKHVFDPFFTTKEAGKGTGLGLSITYGLVKKLGGNIDVISEVGKGTVFYVSLPIENPKGGMDENG